MTDNTQPGVFVIFNLDPPHDIAVFRTWHSAMNQHGRMDANYSLPEFKKFEDYP